jgi:hypothetical protein
MHGSSTSKHNPARLHGCYASKELGLDSVRTSSKGRERVRLCVSDGDMIISLVHRMHPNAGVACPAAS